MLKNQRGREELPAAQSGRSRGASSSLQTLPSWAHFTVRLKKEVPGKTTWDNKSSAPSWVWWRSGGTLVCPDKGGPSLKGDAPQPLDRAP